MTIYSYSFFLVGSIILQGFYGFQIDWNLRSAILAMMVGVIGGIAQVLYNISLQTSSVTYAVVITAIYPAVATLLAFSILGEELTARQIAGLILGFASLILMVKASDKQPEGK
jgi:drug/metabolite transporter (DMT)-like permease